LFYIQWIASSEVRKTFSFMLQITSW